jgi:hypothetical protein
MSPNDDLPKNSSIMLFLLRFLSTTAPPPEFMVSSPT